MGLSALPKSTAGFGITWNEILETGESRWPRFHRDIEADPVKMTLTWPSDRHGRRAPWRSKTTNCGFGAVKAGITEIFDNRRHQSVDSAVDTAGPSV